MVSPSDQSMSVRSTRNLYGNSLYNFNAEIRNLLYFGYFGCNTFGVMHEKLKHFRFTATFLSLSTSSGFIHISVASRQQLLMLEASKQFEVYRAPSTMISSNMDATRILFNALAHLGRIRILAMHTRHNDGIIDSSRLKYRSQRMKSLMSSSARVFFLSPTSISLEMKNSNFAHTHN